MSIRVSLHHVTSYKYARRIQINPQVIRLRPAAHCRTRVASYSLGIEPKDHFLNWQQDPYGNFLARVVVPERTDVFRVEVGLTADMVVINPFDFFLDEDVREFPFAYQPEVLKDLKPYLEVGSPGPLMREYLRKVPRGPMQSLDFLVEINQQLQKDIQYLVRMEPGVQTAEQTLEKGSGSCRDSGWLLVQMLRHLGLAARFVSGYLIQLTADEKPLEGPEGPTEDFTDLHAWTEVFLPGAGWVGLDPTSGLLAGEGHLPLACTPSPISAAPITGTTEKCEAEFAFQMSVERIYEAPRISKPLHEGEWEIVDRLGYQVDDALREMDVRLTMGGEPTFVSAIDKEGAQWQTEALGEDKWQAALDLFQRLSRRFTQRPLHHIGQGKWYPGESLPRWSLDCFWRLDGKPVWNDPALSGDPRDDYGYNAETSGAFVRRLAEVLQIEPDTAHPAHEDLFYYLWREYRLPVNVDPFASRLDDPEERERLIKVFSQGLDHLVGYTLPLRATGTHNGKTLWATGRWHLRSDKLLLIPGDSPMGFRLPLDSLLWEPDDARQEVREADPTAFPEVGPRRRKYRDGVGEARFQHPLETPPEAVATQEMDDPSVVRTAICVEVREGCLYVFMPPLSTFEAYQDLLSAIEQTASDTGTRVIIEGYTPPYHPQVMNFSIRPDPGVIEVNGHPAANWDELKFFTDVIYDEAKQTRLTAEKYDLDGRATGTGGGAHIVLGGPTAVDSPLLRRPDLLRSMLAFWNNHPSLSYLFSGMFIGPTCQAPRVDEARNDMVPEMQLAFEQVARDMNVQPWLVDRLFRNIVVDVTGNTHRAEFCIDKLYSPDTPAGRRGLLELRAFEMPPHPQMNLIQQLLVRAIVATFWAEPYVVPPVRWNTGLHDRFMLPHFVWTDFMEVLDHLRRAGYNFDPNWFAAQFDFRFPKLGEIAHDGVRMQLRAAIEPWHVLGEQPGAGGTARYVDSSVERVEVLVTGLIKERHTVTCNGYRVPLHPTGAFGEAVAAVRYRAWQPPHCLHPNIPVNTPLVFDLVDCWNERALGGCTLCSAHPGGMNYETFPVNANEAEARRQVLFSAMGHTRGAAMVHELPPIPEYPMTLDLRWAHVQR